MPFSALPLISRVASRVTRRRLLQRPERTEVICAAERRISPSSLCLPDDMDRVIACTAESGFDLERERLAGGMKEHGATLLRTFRDVTILDGSLYGAGTYHAVRPTRRRIIKVKDFARLESGLLCSNYVIDRYFGHWLTDGLPLEALARERGLPGITLEKARWSHEQGYRTLVGLSDAPVFAAKLSRLSIADDRGLNSNWRARIHKLKEAVRGSDPTGQASSRVFLLRGNAANKRSLINEEEVSNALQAQGFIVLSPEREDASHIAGILRNASLVVSVEGSTQAHMVMAAAPGSTLLTIMPPRNFNSVFKPICDALGIAWAFTVADDRGTEQFFQPVDRLLRLIDAIDRK